MRNRILCAIPARGGSKRLPRKNILPLAGRPMIAYTIEAALESRLFDEVFVCTDDEEIADVARAHGASVPMLMPDDLCADQIPSHIPCQYLAQELDARGKRHDVLLCLQPTSPLRSASDIRAAVERFSQGEVDFVVSVTPIDPHYFHWAIMQSGRGEWRPVFGDEYMVDRHLLPTRYRPNGSIKLARIEALKKSGHFFGAPLGVIETPEARSVHVATRLDFELCEMLLRRSAI